MNTTSSIIKLTTDIYDALNNGQNLIAFFIDLTKAFDLLNSNLLCQKLKLYGFCQKSISLVESYFKNRTIQVFSSNTTSEKFHLLLGVPQGSILGPLFFLIYINDMFSLKIYSSINAFADDTVCYRNILSVNDAQQFTSDVSMLLNWFSSNKLILNENKCVLINFHLKKNILNPLEFLLINNVKYIFSPSVTYLGLSFTQSLTFIKQYNLIKSRAYYYLNLLKFLSNFLPKFIITKIYLSFILPNFEYCSIIFICTNKILLKKLEKINIKLLNLTSLNII